MNENRAGKRLDILDVHYSLTCLLQVCANKTLKYRNQKTMLSIEILLQSPHSQLL